MADILVTGATGNTGSHVASGLRGLGHRVRTASRHPDPADADAQRFDWADEATFAPALSGVRAVYLVAPVAVSDPVSLVRPFLEHAIDGGVRRVVALSSSAVRRGEPGLGEIHDVLATWCDDYTVLRPSWFMQNFVGDHPLAEGIRQRREVITATGAGRVGFIDATDIAAVAVRVLTSPEPVCDELILTGPEALSYPEAAALLSELLGERVRHVDLTTSELTVRLSASGFPPAFAAALAGLDERIRGGEQDLLTTVVADITGRPPMSLRQFLSDRLDALRPSVRA